LKFLVVDDYAVTRDGVRLALAALADRVVVLDAENVEQALEAIECHPDIDLMLLDLGLPGTGGLSLLRQLRSNHSTVPVVVLSGADDREHVLRALNLGASGFIPKSSSVELMLQAIRLVLSGGTYIPQQALGSSPSARGDAPADPRRMQDLTPRQRQTLALMAQGKSNKIIAIDLNISEATVKSHVTEILRVLKVTNRTQAVIVAGELDVT
jgi:DNA-binding NarL/FixJ family response regulator